MSRKGGATTSVAKEAPWRASSSSVKPIPKIHHSLILRVPNNPTSNYAFSILKQENPIGNGFVTDVVVESAGPDCIVPGQITPLKLLGLKVWPIDVNLKFLEPVGRELKLLGKYMDDAINLMNKSFIDR